MRNGLIGVTSVALVGVAAMLIGCQRAVAQEAPTTMHKSISQYGITWTFTEPVRAGQFVAGDWWVIGPVTVASVTPAPGPVQDDPGNVQRSRYGAAATQPDARMRNGSMIVVKSLGKQGYDSRLRNYDPKLSVKFPVKLEANMSLVSTVSGCLDGEKTNQLFHKRMWASEKQGLIVLKTAAVLTVLTEAPPADAFRPPYAGTSKPIHTFSQVKTDKLLSLEPAADMPTWSEFERYLERPWLDHTTGWLHQYTGPSENQVNYGREFARITGMAGLMLNTKAPIETKKKLLVGMIQLGIDLNGVIEAGRQYAADGGHYSGRKLPILLAGVLLGDKAMSDPNTRSYFAEDFQTYYGTGWAGQRALYQIVIHTGPKPPHEELPPSKWNDMHRRGEGYRTVNGTAWPATALTVRLMGLVKQWDHDAYFDYVDRWMSPTDAFAEYRQAQPQRYRARPKMAGRTFDSFTDNMWARYRPSAPEPHWAGHPRKWVWVEGNRGEWIDNPKPTEAQAKAHADAVRARATQP